MAPRKYRLHDAKAGAALAVRITPLASRNRITEELGDGTVKIQLTAPPVDGEANAQLIGFLAEVLDIARSHIEIVAGSTGRDKLVSVTGMNAATLHEQAQVVGLFCLTKGKARATSENDIVEREFSERDIAEENERKVEHHEQECRFEDEREQAEVGWHLLSMSL